MTVKILGLPRCAWLCSIAKAERNDVEVYKLAMTWWI